MTRRKIKFNISVRYKNEEKCENGSLRKKLELKIFQMKFKKINEKYIR